MGLIKEEEKCYRVIKFTDILREYNNETDLIILQHNLLSKKSIDTKEIQKELENILVEDNVVAPQEFKINQKKRDISILKQVLFRTEKNETFLDKKEFNRFKKLRKDEKTSVDYLNRLEKSLSDDIRTSARHLATILKISHTKANQIICNLSNFQRKERILWVNGANVDQVYALRKKFPSATIYPMVSLNKTKIHFGSSLIEIPGRIKPLSF